MAQMEQPYPLDPQDDLRFWLEDQTFTATGEQLATYTHAYEDGDGLEIHSKSLTGQRLYYYARWSDTALADGTVRSVTFSLVGNGSPPQKVERTVSFVVRRSTSLG